MSRKTVINAGVILLLVGLCSASGVAGGRVWQYAIDRDRKLDEIAKRLSVRSDWRDIREHVYCEMLEIGEDRESIQERLQFVGPYTYFPPSDVNSPARVVFHDYFTRVELSDLYLQFDRQELLTYKARQRGLGDEVSIACSE
jgi:hypothetical protein